MSGTMRAVRYHSTSGELAIEEVPIPEPGPMEVLVKVEACGICLSDVHLIDRSIPAVIPDVTPGHEASGTIAKAGELVQGWKVGDRVTLAGGKPCMQCANCTRGLLEECLMFQIMGFMYDGAWAEYVVAPFFTISAVPENVPMEQAAIIADAVATPYAALSHRAALRPGEAVGLWGIGGLGTHATQIARMLGAGLIIAVDPLKSARKRAISVGADIALDPETEDVQGVVLRETGGIGLDVALDLVGKNTVLMQAQWCLSRGGRLVMVGLSMDPLELGPGIVFGARSISLLGHLGYRKPHLDELLSLVSRGRLDLSGSISDVISLDEVPDGVRRLSEKEGDPVRIVVRPNV
ncbi:MAG TPA: zinc-binding dehydrogenase [Actinomycetota bacterium]|nr:zinc-binding dehydrogenase [Actinomycetota bacterium]